MALCYPSCPVSVKLADKTNHTVTRVESEQSISSSCLFTLSIIADNEININKVLGKPLEVTYVQTIDTQLYQGIASSIELVKFDQHYYYTICACDPLSLLVYRHNRKIFQNMTTKAILQELFDNSGFGKYFSFSTAVNGMKHEYCVQLDETDLQFSQRLLASEGWHYHLEYDNSKYKPYVVIGDSNHKFKIGKLSTIGYAGRTTDADEFTINNWVTKTRIGTSKVSLTDHTQNQAEVFDSGEMKSTFPHNPAEFTASHFGLGNESKNAIRSAADRHIQALDSELSTTYAESDLAGLSCGRKFNLKNHPISKSNQEYLVTKINFLIECEHNKNTSIYHNKFVCMPTTSTYRPQPINKPRVHSVHTASITGPKGQEIYRDKLGRVKVKFHWDSQGKEDENSSCWLSVSQSLASKGFGSQFIPRVGDEVLVQYIDGDPDRPVIVGSLYTKVNTNPYSEATQSGIKTRTSPKGSSSQGNELRFEDKKDKEHFFIHAEKDLMFDINNNHSSTVKGEKRTQVDKGVSLKAKDNILVESDKSLQSNSKDNWSAKSDKDIALSAKSAVTVDGDNITLTGKKNIELKVGASSINITSSGITIKSTSIKIDGSTINIKASGQAQMSAALIKIKGDATAEVKSALLTLKGDVQTTVKGGAMVQIQGGIAKIN